MAKKPTVDIGAAIAIAVGKTLGTRKPIGVESDYKTQGIWVYGPDGTPMQVSGAPIGKKQADLRAAQPLYWKGDADRPGARSPEEIAQLQQALVEVGLLSAKRMRLGQWDGASKAAFTNLLGQANRAGMPWEMLLTQQLDLAAQGLLGSPGSRQPLTVQLTNEADIKAGVDQAAPALLGRTLQPEEQRLFVQQYHDLERNAQTAAYNTAPAGGTVIAAPGLASFLDQQIKQQYQTEYQGNQLGRNGAAILKMLTESAAPGGLEQAQR